VKGYCDYCGHPEGYHTDERGCIMPVDPGTFSPFTSRVQYAPSEKCPCFIFQQD
jgi:hypothetical protein